MSEWVPAIYEELGLQIVTIQASSDHRILNIPSLRQFVSMTILPHFDDSAMQPDLLLVERPILKYDDFFPSSLPSVSSNKNAEFPHIHHRVILVPDEHTVVGTRVWSRENLASLLGSPPDDTMIQKHITPSLRYSSLISQSYVVDYRKYALAVLNDDVWHSRDMCNQNGRRSNVSDGLFLFSHEYLS